MTVRLGGTGSLNSVEVRPPGPGPARRPGPGPAQWHRYSVSGPARYSVQVVTRRRPRLSESAAARAGMAPARVRPGGSRRHPGPTAHMTAGPGRVTGCEPVTRCQCHRRRPALPVLRPTVTRSRVTVGASGSRTHAYGHYANPIPKLIQNINLSEKLNGVVCYLV